MEPWVRGWTWAARQRLQQWAAPLTDSSPPPGIEPVWMALSSGGPILSGIPYGYPGGPLGVVGLLRALATPAKVQVREEVGAVEGTAPADTGPVFFAGREVA